MFNKAVADEAPEFLPGTLMPIQVPMACGESTTVLTQIVNGFKMKSLAAGQVKAGVGDAGQVKLRHSGA